MNKDKCPYCDTEVEICHDDGYGYEESTIHHQECHNCNKVFVYETSIVIYHNLSKAPCLNEETPHEFKRTITYPKTCSRMRCTVCEEERPCTKAEMEAD